MRARLPGRHLARSPRRFSGVGAEMFERKKHPPVSRRRFAGRMGKAAALASALVVAALGVGVSGYHWLAGFGWSDSLLNASMILTGMGPVGTLSSRTAKLFASAYALFSGLIFLSILLTLLAPVFHRILHTFHVDDSDGS